MRSDILIKIRTDPYLYSYLKYHSYWYKNLLRNPDSITEMIREMKKEYKLTTADKLNRINDRINTIKTFLDVLS